MSLHDFVRESNRIEGIMREPTEREIEAHEFLLSVPSLSVYDIEAFVASVAPNKPLRRIAGLDVRVGSHVAPPGGPNIETALASILADANAGHDPYVIHHRYETLHPFCDGNGRSGRAIWLWQTKEFGRLERALSLGFLHSWYYQTLSHGLPPATQEQGG